MHELGIVFHIIRHLETVSTENRLQSVSAVTLELGEVSGVVAASLLDCWRWAADRSELLRGAKLKIETLAAVTFCENCSQTYATVAHGKVCPLCGSENTVLASGNEINIKEIEAC